MSIFFKDVDIIYYLYIYDEYNIFNFKNAIFIAKKDHFQEFLINYFILVFIHYAA